MRYRIALGLRNLSPVLARRVVVWTRGIEFGNASRLDEHPAI